MELRPYSQNILRLIIAPELFESKAADDVPHRISCFGKCNNNDVLKACVVTMNQIGQLK